MKTEIIFSFSQLPKTSADCFAALYPETVGETPVKVVIDPEKQSLDITLGAREMSFGPANENYSVFLQDCYRMLFKAAQKQGWLSRFEQDVAAAAPQTAPAQAQAAPAPAAPAPEPPPAPAPVEPPVPVKAASRVASSDPTPKPEDALYVRPLDFMNRVRKDWLDWAKNDQGVDHLTEQEPRDAHQASSKLADASGWEKTSSFWTNPKGLQVADDSRLVSQLRKATTKKAPEGDASQILDHTENPVEKLADGTSGEAKIEEEAQIQKIAKTVSEHLKEVSTAKTASGLDFRAKLAAIKAAFAPEVATAVERYVDTHAGTLMSLQQLKESAKSFTAIWKDMLNYMNQSHLLKEENGSVRVLSRTEAEDDADRSQNMGSPKYASTKEASGYHDRFWITPELEVFPVKGDDDEEIHEDVAERHGFPGCYEAKKAGWVRVGMRGSMAYLQFHTLTDAQLRKIQDILIPLVPQKVKVEGDGLYEEFNDQEEVAEFFAAKRVSAFRKRFVSASTKHASGYHDRFWITPELKIYEVQGDEEDELHSDVAEREAGSYNKALSLGWIKVGMCNNTGYFEYETITNAQLRAIQDKFMALNPDKITVYGPNINKLYRGQEAVGEFLFFKSVNDLSKRELVYASVKKARQSDAQPVDTYFASFPITIDCPAGCTVSGTDPDGSSWSRTQSVNYGEIKDTVGGDSEPVDVFLGEDENSPWVFVINQTKAEGEQVVPDEIKVGLGFWSLEDARDAYLSMFDPGWNNYDPNIVTASTESFREWLTSHEQAQSVTADDLTLTTTTPEQVIPAVVNAPAVVAPEVISDFSNGPTTAYVASVKDIHSKHQADVATSFSDPSKQGLDHVAATLANLLSGQTFNPMRGHVASFDSQSSPSIDDDVKVSFDGHKASMIPTASKVRIAEIVTAQLNIGYSPEECDHRASIVGYYGADQKEYRQVLARLAGVAGELTLKPNFIKNSCTLTHSALTTQYKDVRKKIAFHSVASTSECGGCENCKCGKDGKKHCALYHKPIVASVAEMHSLADQVWGKSKEAATPLGLNKRATAHRAARNNTSVQTPMQVTTASVSYGDQAESRPTPSAVASRKANTDPNPRIFVMAALSQGLTPSRIGTLIDRSVTHSATFKEAATKELNSQKGLFGFLTIIPHFAGNCSATHGKHFAATARPQDRRKFAFHSVTKISACEDCRNCVKTASGQSRCSLFGKPLVSTVSDLRRVVATAFPSLASKVAGMSKEEMAHATLPFLAKTLGIPENHPSLKVISDMAVRGAQEDPTEAKPFELAKVPVTEPNVPEGTSKNVMDIALSAGKPKTEDLEKITTTIKEAANNGLNTQQIYDEVKRKHASVDRKELKTVVNHIASQTISSRSAAKSNEAVYASVENEKLAGLKIHADLSGELSGPSFTDSVIDLTEFAGTPSGSDEFTTIQDFCF